MMLEQFSGGDRVGRAQLLAVDAEFLARLDLVPHVDFGGRVVADQHHHQAGRASAFARASTRGLHSARICSRTHLPSRI